MLSVIHTAVYSPGWRGCCHGIGGFSCDFFNRIPDFAKGTFQSPAFEFFAYVAKCFLDVDSNGSAPYAIGRALPLRFPNGHNPRMKPAYRGQGSIISKPRWNLYGTVYESKVPLRGSQRGWQIYLQKNGPKFTFFLPKIISFQKRLLYLQVNKDMLCYFVMLSVIHTAVYSPGWRGCCHNGSSSMTNPDIRILHTNPMGVPVRRLLNLKNS